MEDIFYGTMQDLGPPPSKPQTDSIFYETLADLGPTPTAWRYDIWEDPTPPAPPPPIRVAMRPVDEMYERPYPRIEFDRTPSEPWWRRALATPVGTIWVVVIVATVALVASLWALL